MITRQIEINFLLRLLAISAALLQGSPVAYSATPVFDLGKVNALKSSLTNEMSSYGLNYANPLSPGVISLYDVLATLELNGITSQSALSAFQLMIQATYPAQDTRREIELPPGSTCPALIDFGNSATALPAVLPVAGSIPCTNPNFGRFFWSAGDMTISATADLNATAFASLALAIFYNRALPVGFGLNNLDNNQINYLHSRMDAAANWLLHSLVQLSPPNTWVVSKPNKIDYTNIYLASTAGIILLAEGAGDYALAQQGYALFDQWVQYTAAGGISEFISPTYTAVDLMALETLYQFMQPLQAIEKTKVASTLDFIWADLLLNMLPSTGNLCGAHARDYDWIQGVDNGGMNLRLWLEASQNSLISMGLNSGASVFSPGSPLTADVNLQNMVLYDWVSNPAGAYVPDWMPGTGAGSLPPFMLAGGANTTTLVESFAAGNNGSNLPISTFNRTNYVSQNYCMGHSDTDRGEVGNQNKPFNLSVASQKPYFPNVVLVASDTNNPYGEDNLGYMNPLSSIYFSSAHQHLNLNPLSAQNQNTLLTTFDLDPSALPSTLLTSLSGSQVNYGITISATLPSMADEVWLDTNQVMANGSFIANGVGAGLQNNGSYIFQNGHWIFFRENNVGVALQMDIVDRLQTMQPAGISSIGPSIGFQLDQFIFSPYPQNQTPGNGISSAAIPNFSGLRILAGYQNLIPQAFTQRDIRGYVYAQVASLTGNTSADYSASFQSFMGNVVSQVALMAYDISEDQWGACATTPAIASSPLSCATGTQLKVARTLNAVSPLVYSSFVNEQPAATGIFTVNNVDLTSPTSPSAMSFFQNASPSPGVTNSIRRVKR